MIKFQILKQSKKSRARLGILKTPHGEVETPSLVPVATRAAVKTLTSNEAIEAGSQLLITNTFHLHLKPGEKIVKSAGGLHEFMQWPRPLMTDSGGYQVFSLGFGRDHTLGKLSKHTPASKEKSIHAGARAADIRIKERGVLFKSPIDGREIFMGPKESIAIQERLGADIMFSFDECTPSTVSKAYARHALDQNHRWAVESLRARKGKQALFGIVHGSRFRDMRTESAKYINSLGFDGYGIGGDLGDVAKEKRTMINILRWTTPHLDEQKPRHLLGIGLLEDMERIVKEGIDLFDCTVPTRSARHGLAYTSKGRIDLTKAVFLRDKKPLDPKCSCRICATYKKNYIAHLMRAGEPTGARLLTIHNLHYFNAFVAEIRQKIKNGKI